MARSPVPRLVGIAMLVIAAAGIVFAIREMAVGDAPARFSAIPLVFALFDLAIDVLQIVAGIRAITYNPSAIGLAVFYAGFKIVAVLVQLLLVVTWLAPAIADTTGASASEMIQTNLQLAAISVAWPVIVLIAMTRPSVRRIS